MKVVKPVTITEAMLVSSSVPEADYAAYSAGTDYAVGARVVYQHAVYESVQTPNVGHAPDVSPLYWANVGPTNRWQMFDQEVSTQTSRAGDITVVLAPGIVNSLALIGLEGASLSVTVRDGAGGPVVFSHAQSLDGTVIVDWYQYFFEPSVQLGEVALTNLPPYGAAQITVAITGAGTVKCGGLIVGTCYTLGEMEYGASAGITDYSRKETSAAGVATLVKRKFSKRSSQRLWVDNGALNKVYRVLADLRATPCVWIGVDATGYEPFTVFGFYRDFNIEVAYPVASYCSLDIEGLT